MTTFHITWRPSGGRGEYEYSPLDKDFEHKLIQIELLLDEKKCVIPTDARLEQTGGKRRIRRDNPNDRKHLSVPGLVAAIMGLPKPTRDRANLENASLNAGRWAVGSVDFQVLSAKSEPLLRIAPISLKPRHFKDAIAVADRIKVLMAEALGGGELGGKAKSHLQLVADGVNDVELEESAHEVFTSFSSTFGDVPTLATPSELGLVDALEAGDAATVPAYSGVEGKKRVVAHVLRERDKSIVKKKKNDFRGRNGGRIFCECCGLEPIDMYGDDIDGIIEAHHRVPLMECADDEVRVTSIDDLILLCRNCHGVIHRISPMPALAELKKMLRKTFNSL